MSNDKDFKVGDIVEGIKGNKYGYTNGGSINRVEVILADDEMQVTWLSGSSPPGVTVSFTVEKAEFKLYKRKRKPIVVIPQ